MDVATQSLEFDRTEANMKQAFMTGTPTHDLLSEAVDPAQVWVCPRCGYLVSDTQFKRIKCEPICDCGKPWIYFNPRKDSPSTSTEQGR